MEPLENAKALTQADVDTWLIEAIKKRIDPRSGFRERYGNYGFDIYLHNLVMEYLLELGERDGSNNTSSQAWVILEKKILNAAWELSIRGILMPLKKSLGHDGNNVSGGFSCTAYGQAWILEPSSNHLTFTNGQMGQLFHQHENRFGKVFTQRAQEALRCFQARAYFACCAMAGAASESILIELAIEKLKDEKEVLRIYHGKQGRKDLKDKILLLGQRPDRVKHEVEAGFTILAYWRDDAAHGSSEDIGMVQASVALQMLCLFCLSVDKNWSLLTS